jgi:hypothetical protein
MPVSDGLFDFRAIPAKALGKSLPPVASPPHLEEVIRRAKPEENREQYVI